MARKQNGFSIRTGGIKVPCVEAGYLSESSLLFQPKVTPESESRPLLILRGKCACPSRARSRFLPPANTSVQSRHNLTSELDRAISHPASCFHIDLLSFMLHLCLSVSLLNCVSTEVAWIHGRWYRLGHVNCCWPSPAQ
jgi:hypothetical protein